MDITVDSHSVSCPTFGHDSSMEVEEFCTTQSDCCVILNTSHIYWNWKKGEHSYEKAQPHRGLPIGRVLTSLFHDVYHHGPPIKTKEVEQITWIRKNQLKLRNMLRYSANLDEMDKYWVQFYICSENVNTLVKQYNKDIWPNPFC